MTSLALDQLRRQLDDTQPVVRPPADGIVAFPTGIAALDAVLPAGGLPRGRLTELRAAPGQGRTTLLRTIVGTTLAAGRWVAIVDASRTLAAADWAPLLEQARRARAATGWTPGRADDATVPRLAVVRPPDPSRAAWCADVLLRAGAFALVVLDGVATLPRATVVRLARLAHDRQVALVLAGDDAPGTVAPIGAALRLAVSLGGETAITMTPSSHPRRDGASIRPLSIVRQRFATTRGSDAMRPSPARLHAVRRRQSLLVQVTKGATPATIRLPYAIVPQRHLARHPLPPDRKAAARSAAPRR
ncbi:MAG: hypothetical protein MUF40_05130 [Gemmatimonadaceae bacterium]|nr:hypothetical protein [Gemmatimonadaceae bacterium]